MNTVASIGLLIGMCGTAAAGALKSDEHVLLYPAVASATADGWELQIRGIVYEPERRRFVAALLGRAMGLAVTELPENEQAIWQQRSQYFLVDNERGKKLTLNLGGRDYPLGTSAPNGHFHATLKIDQTSLPGCPDSLSDENLIFPCEIRSLGKPARSNILEVQFVSAAGVSIVSDIDDTIKVSNVLKRDELIRNTFARPFVAVPGMAAIYQEWARAGGQFHYVTASPWQLYLPLSEFVRSNGFPAGGFHMKMFRVKDGSFVSLFQSPERYKPAVIESLFVQYPKRRFILVGDSGEKDPEIYGALARQHPQRVQKIYIREVTDDSGARYNEAFQELPRERWQIFKVPSEIGP